MTTSEQPPDGSDDGEFWNQLDDDQSFEPADWAGDELEQAYLKAMEALEASNAQLPELPEAPPVQDSNAEPVIAAETGSPQSLDRQDAIPSAELAAEISQLSKEAQQSKQTASAQTATVNPRQIL